MRKCKWEYMSTNQYDEICKWLNRMQEKGDVVDLKMVMHGYAIIAFAKLELKDEDYGSQMRKM